MARIVLSSSASADQTEILNDLKGTAGFRTAAKFRGLFRALYDRLAEHPALGAPRPALGRNTRIGIVSPYIVIYRHNVDDDTATVLRIVHGRRRITGKLLSEDA